MRSGAEPEEDTRHGALTILLGKPQRAKDAVSQLRRFPFDTARDIVTLDSSDVGNALRQYLVGDLAGSEIEFWANAIEGRGDIGFQDARVRALLHWLANPVLEGPLDQASARRALDGLA